MSLKFDLEDVKTLMIAVAITALKHKPLHMSIPAYAVQLKTLFHPAIRPGFPLDSASTWQKRAFALESDLMALRDKYNVDCAELTVLRAKLVMDPTPCTDEGSAMNSNIPTALKKKKKKQAPGSNNGGEASRSTVIFMETSPGRNRPRDIRAPAVTEGLRVLSSLQQLRTTHSAKALKAAPIPVERLMLLTTTVVDGLGKKLSSILRLENFSGNYQESLRDIDRTLSFSLDCALASLHTTAIRRSTPLAAKILVFSSLVDQLFSSLTTWIVIPIIQALPLLSKRVLESRIHQEPIRGKKPADPRPVLDIRRDVLSLLLNCTHTLQNHNRVTLNKTLDFRGFITAIATRQIASLWPLESNTHTRRPLTREERIITLSRKETLALLCSVLHEVVPHLPTDEHLNKRPHTVKNDTAINDAMLQEVSNTLSHILTRSTDQNGMMSEVEKGLLMAVIERTWLEGVVPLYDFKHV